MQVTTLLKSGALTLAQLQEAPYFLRIKTQGNLHVLNYCQINSPETNNIVRECRGLILDSEFSPVSVGFHRFSNFNVQNHKINWSEFRAYHKLDGSLITLYNYLGEWKFATRGNVVADGFIMQSKSNFAELLTEATQNTGLADLTKVSLNPDITYIFEITSPKNCIVTPYEATTLTLLGARNKLTGEELSWEELDILAASLNIARPSFEVFNSYEEAIERLKAFPIRFEGFVLVHPNGKTPTGMLRYKLKSPAYVALHHLKGEVTSKNILQVLVYGEQTELISSLPHEKDRIMALADNLAAFKADFESNYTQAVNEVKNRVKTDPTLVAEAQKQIFAKCLQTFPHKNLAFSVWLHGKPLSSLLTEMDPAKLLKLTQGYKK